MKKTFPDFPGWTFEMDEVSAGLYEVRGWDRSGNSVSAEGIDLDETIEKCREAARAYFH